MTATDPDALAMHPIIESCFISRIFRGEVVESELMIGLTPGVPALLSIAEGWLVTKNRFKHFASYECHRQPIAEGRQFRLVRDPATVEREREKDPTAPAFYFVTYFPDGKLECDCKGRFGTERAGNECKHVAVTRHLLAEGHL